MVAGDVQARGGHDGREARHQGSGLEVDGGGAVAKGLLEEDADPAIGEAKEPVVGQRRTQDVAAQGLAPALVVGVDVGRGVQRKAAEVGGEPPRGAQMCLGAVTWREDDGAFRSSMRTRAPTKPSGAQWPKPWRAPIRGFRYLQ
jgi:hypothetical protein